MGGLRKGCDLGFYRCVFRTEYGCEHFKGKESECAYGVASAFIPKKDLNALKSDMKQFGYSSIPMELHIVYANKVDWIIEYENEETQSLKLATNRETVAPLCVADLKGKRSGVLPALRASELNKKCHCQRIWSKVRKDRFGLRDSGLSLVGQAAHAVCNQQHLPYIVENSLLEEIHQPAISRAKYCEVELFLDREVDGEPVCVSGHADGVLRMVPKERLRNNAAGDIVIFDLKRKAYSRFEEWGFKMQELTYGLALEQQYGLDSEWIYLMTAKRPRKSAWNDYRTLQYHLTKVKNSEESPTVQRLEELIAETYVAQRDLLSDLDLFEENKVKMEKKGFCNGCYDTEICKLAIEEAERDGVELVDLFEGKKAVAPRMILPR